MSHPVANPNPIMIAPFALLLGLIALAPLLAPKWWHRWYTAVAFGLGAITVTYYLAGLHAGPRVLAVAHEYVSFMSLIGALYVVAGGIHIRVRGEGTPAANTLFLLVGALIANVLGTTGSSMLLIRPWLRVNRHRIAAFHVVFFIFIVSNVGGGLTPIGDPPLFLGYLQGVPFWWVAQEGWQIWATALGALLLLFYLLDRRNFARAPRAVQDATTAHHETWAFEGLRNLAFLAVILVAVFIHHPLFLREGLMLAAAVGSYVLTPRRVHEANRFNFDPVREVAVLFVGIFATMMPALDWLSANAERLLGQQAIRGTFYWGTGILSSVLDNAPTYLSFLSAAVGMVAPPELRGSPDAIVQLLQDPRFAEFVLEISMGAVFFGAMTYIGNGPNFMVKAIAEHARVPVPGFLQYVTRFALPFLLPVLLLVWFVFLRG